MSQLRIAYCSDLHLEFELDYAKKKPIKKLTKHGICNTDNANVLVLAGDVFPVCDLRHGYLDTFFNNTSSEFDSIIWVIGNHEHYKGFIYEDEETIKKYVSRWKNIHVLHNNSIEIQGIYFFGATLWTDMDRCNPNIMFYSRQVMNDYHCIMKDSQDYYMIDAEDTIKEHKISLDKLKEFLSKDLPSVVISHHAPSFKSIHDRYKTITGISSTFFYYSDLDYLMHEHDNIHSWIHGHVHHNFDYVINKTRVLCNPRGYVGYEKESQNFSLKYIDI